MALSHGQNKIVTNGLVMCLDAANIKSYPGSGNTWFDLTGTGNNAILNGNANNPVWNSAGYFNFTAASTGINAGMIINNSSSLQSISDMTVEIVFTLETKALAGDSDWMALFSKSATSGNQAPAISINQGTSGLRYLHIERPTAFNSSANIFTDYTGNRWYYVTALLSSTSFGYLNGIQVSTASGGISANSSPIYLGLSSATEMFKGKMAIVKVYNRALTFSEITKNFDAMKERFAL